jgi:hypothetical protein
MSSPLLRWFVLGFACLWFGMLVPVHQRGMIQLPGAADARGLSHCNRGEERTASCCKTQTKQNGGGKAPVTQGNCAVCHFIAGLHAPPPVTMYIAQLGLLRDQPLTFLSIAPLRHAALPFHGLDPPRA